jgi:hypothetical protein
MKLKSFLEDKYVLYIVAFITFTNFMGYLLFQDTEAIVFMVIIGYLATYFSKNMILVLLIALITTNFLVGVRVLNGRRTVEGYTGNSRRKTKQQPPSYRAATEDEEDEEIGKKPSIQKNATTEAAYDNIGKVLNNDSLGAMTMDTAGLLDKQNMLMDSIEKMEPMMDKAASLMEKFDLEKMSNMAEKFTGIASKIGVGGGGMKKP